MPPRPEVTPLPRVMTPAPVPSKVMPAALAMAPEMEAALAPELVTVRASVTVKGMEMLSGPEAALLAMARVGNASALLRTKLSALPDVPATIRYLLLELLLVAARRLSRKGPRLLVAVEFRLVVRLITL